MTMTRRLSRFVAVAAFFPLFGQGLQAAEEPKVELAKKAQGILKAHCYKCHGEAGAVEGGMNYINELDRLVVRKKVIPGKPDESPIFKRINNGSMPPPDVTSRVTDAEKAIVKQWIEAGAPSPHLAAPRQFITQADVQDAILADLEKLDRRSRRFMRYFTFSHLWNAGLSDDELQTYRNSLNKVVNSLSWHPKIRNPEPIDATAVVLRIDLRWYMWDSTLWNRILNEYPYGVLDDSTALRAILVSTATKVPMLRGDWFVASASRPPLYQDILQLPGNLAELERQLRVDAAQNITQERVMRVAFNGSGIAKNNRVLERHDAVHGYYWRTYDFDEVPQNLIERGQLLPDRRNVFAYPLGPGNLENTFQHAGGEAIFSLPNGLQGYFIMNAVNNRLDKAPNQIVTDPKRPDKAVEMGVSCMGCHIPGVHVKADQMHDFLLKNPKAIAKVDADIAKSLYPPKEKSTAQMEEDGKKYREAVNQTGAKIAKAEPIITMTQRYEGDIDAISSAAEAGLKYDDFQKRLSESDLLSRNLGALRVPGGTVARQVWVQAFGDLVRALKLGVLFQANQVGAALPDNTGELDPLEVAVGQVNHMVFSPDGRLALIASADRSVQFYEVEGKRVLKRLLGHTASVWSAALSRDGKYALSGGMDGTVRFWRVEDAQQLRKLDAHASLVTAVAFTPDGKRAISGGFDGAVVLWDLNTGTELRRLEGPMKYVNALAVSPDGKRALIAADKWIRLWDLDAGNEVRKFEGHTAPVNAVCFSADGKKALSGSDDRTVRLWDVESAKQEQIFSGHENSVRAVALNAKGNWALSGGSDATVRLWQTSTGKELGRFAKHVEPIVQVAFLDNGSQTLSGSRDNALLLWSIERFLPPQVEPKQPAPAASVLQLKPILKVPVDGAIGKLFLSPDRQWLYFFERSSDRVGRIEVASGKITNSLTVEGIEDLRLTSDGKQLLALTSEIKKGAVHFLDPRTLEAGLSVPLKFEPRAFRGEREGEVAIKGEGPQGPKWAWFSHASPGRAPVEYKPSAVPDSALATKPLALAADQETKIGYRVTQLGWLERFDLPDEKAKERWKLPLTAYQIAFDAKAGRLYLAVIDPQALVTRPRARGFGDVWVIDVKDLPK
jgi:WD40 repeat protein/mono/diheme cytochrome c family protein